MRPDGWIDKVKLRSDQKVETYRIGGLNKRMIPKGNCKLIYTPEIEGNYIIEINSKKFDLEFIKDTFALSVFSRLK